jgi:hypothetical protein
MIIFTVQVFVEFGMKKAISEMTGTMQEILLKEKPLLPGQKDIVSVLSSNMAVIT